VQVDELWSFCYAKARNVTEETRGQIGFGDVWTWTAIDADSKLPAEHGGTNLMEDAGTPHAA